MTLINKIKFPDIVLIISILIFTGCVGDLDTVPIDKDVVTASSVYDDPQAYLSVLAKLYAGLAVTGQEGPSGQGDIEGIDEGFGQYVRMYWYHQELTTDEAVVGWNDQTIKDFHGQNWSSDDGFIFAMYSRIFYQIALCNEFLRETTDEKLAGRGVDTNLMAEIQTFRAEARFLRALSYYHALDFFRNVPFVTENDQVGSFFPEQIQAADLFNYIESELKAIEGEISPVKSAPYGRADQGAVWTLLAKLYLNAESYTGSNRYSDCVEYSNKVINGGYSLEPDYQNLFLADNNNSDEMIFPVAFDGINTRTWGGMTFIIRAGIGGSMDPTEFGVESGWGGTRTTRQLIEKFPEDVTGIISAANSGNTARYPKIYVPGAYQGWTASNTETSLSSVNSDKIYEGHVYFPEDNSPFLFTTIPSFALSLGDNGGDGTLEMQGDTILAPEAGLYYIRVDLNNNTYTMEKRTWGILGDATSVGWEGDDLDMVWNQEEQALEINLDLTQGAVKFRANNSWDINLGDNDGDGILSQGGADIQVQPGAYRIVLYLDKPDYTYAIFSTSFDRRGLFWSDGQNLDINDLTIFTEGYAITKFKNVNSDGSPGSDFRYPDTDFPMFRLADVYLMASEALLRSGGDRTQALDYFNRVRTRAYGSPSGGIQDGDLTLDMILDERARELYWEGHRRTDLVRFGKFSNTNYMWAWKGGVKEGRSVDDFRDVFPIPSSDLGANPNLVQNSGY